MNNSSSITSCTLLLVLIALIFTTQCFASAPIVSTSYSTVLLWTVCHYATSSENVMVNGTSMPVWTVTTSANMVTSPLVSSSYYNVLSINGVRTQTQYDPVTGASLGTQVALVNGLVTTNTLNYSISNQYTTSIINTNQVNVAYPQLPTNGGGVAFSLDRNVTMPLSTANSTAVSTKVIMLYGDPPVEYYVNPLDTGISYFIFQSSQSSVVLTCPSPPPVTYSFSYIASPTNMPGTAHGYPIWSSCTTGNLTVVGPYALPAITQAGRFAYLVIGATGTRTFVNSTNMQVANIVGVSALDYGDFTVYLPFPYFSYAGFTISLDRPTMVAAPMPPASSTFSPPQYVNLWSSTGSQVSEESIVVSGTSQAYNRMQFSINKWIPGVSSNYQCPTTILTESYSFCMIAISDDQFLMSLLSAAASGNTTGNSTAATNSTAVSPIISWTVMTNGTFFTSPMLANGTRVITAIGGRRIQWNSDGSFSNVSILYQSNNNQLNFININFPQFDNFVGFSYSLSTSVILPGQTAKTSTVTWLGQPVVESSTISTVGKVLSTGYSSFIWQLSSAGPLNCQVPVTSATMATYYNSSWANFTASNSSNAAASAGSTGSVQNVGFASTVPFSFYYSATPTDSSTWSTCASGLMQLAGPISQPGANSNVSSFQVSSIVGSRTFIDEYGNVFQTNILGLASSRVAQSDGMITSSFPYLSQHGLTLVMSSASENSMGNSGTIYMQLRSAALNSSYINMSSNASMSTFLLQEQAVGTAQSIVPTQLVEFVIMPYNSDVGLYNCIVPGVAVGVNVPSAGWTILALVFGNMAMFACFDSLLRFVYASHKGQRLIPGLFLVLASVFMGVGCIWVEIVLLYSQINIPCRSDDCDPVFGYNVQISLQVAALALIPAFLLTFLGFTVMGRPEVRLKCISALKTSQKVRHESSINQSTGASLADGISSGNSTSPAAGGEKVGASPNRLLAFIERMRDGFMHTFKNLNVHVVITAALVASAIILTRVSMLYAVVTEVELAFNHPAAVLSSMLTLVLSGVSLLFVFYSPRILRPLGALALTLTIVIDFFINAANFSATFAPGNAYSLEDKPLLYISSTLLSQTAVAVICASIVLASTFSFAFSQWRMIQASRRALMKAFTKNKAVLNTMEQQNRFLHHQVAFLTAIADEEAHQRDLMNILRPLSAGATNTSTSKMPNPLSPQLLFGSIMSLPFFLNHQFAVGSSSAVSIGDKKVFAAESSKVEASGTSRTKLATSNAEPTNLPEALIPSSWKIRNHREKLLATHLEAYHKQKGSPTIIPLSSWITSSVDLPSHLRAIAELNNKTLDDQEELHSGQASHEKGFSSLDLESYRPNITAVISHPVTAELFKDFMATSMNSENAMFLIAVARFKTLNHKRSREIFGKWIRDDFIVEGASCQVNIDSLLRISIINTIQAQSDNLPIEVFAAAEKEVRALIDVNSWKPFSRTPSYLLCSAILMRHNHFMSQLATTCSFAMKELTLPVESYENMTSQLMSQLSEENADDNHDDEAPSELARSKQRSDSQDLTGSRELSANEIGRTTPVREGSANQRPAAVLSSSARSPSGHNVLSPSARAKSYGNNSIAPEPMTTVVDTDIPQ